MGKSFFFRGLLMLGWILLQLSSFVVFAAQGVQGIPGAGGNQEVVGAQSMQGAQGIPGLLSSLSPHEKQQLQRGEMVCRQVMIGQSPWPQLTVFVQVHASVDQITTVFLDYAHAQEYIPHLVSAKKIATSNPQVWDVEYVTRLPVLGNSRYTVRNWYTKQPDGVQIRWDLVQSPWVSVSKGSLTAETDAGGAILRYQNFVKPKTQLAFVLKGRAANEVKQIVLAIKNQAERLMNTDRGQEKGSTQLQAR